VPRLCRTCVSVLNIEVQQPRLGHIIRNKPPAYVVGARKADDWIPAIAVPGLTNAASITLLARGSVVALIPTNLTPERRPRGLWSIPYSAVRTGWAMPRAPRRHTRSSRPLIVAAGTAR